MTIAHLGRIMDTSPVPLSLLSPTEQIVEVNHAMTDLLGSPTPGPLANQPAFHLVAHELIEQSQHRIRDLADGLLLTSTGPIRVRQTNGEVVGVMASCTAITLTEGPFVLVALTSIADDVQSPPAPATAALAALVTDHDWQVSHVTQAAQDLFGPSAEAVGVGLFGLIHPSDIGSLARAIEHLGGNAAAMGLPLRIRSDDGWRAVVLHVSSLCAHVPARLICLLSDRAKPAGDREPIWDAEALEGVEPQFTGAPLLGAVANLIHRHPDEAELSLQDWEILARSLRGETPAEMAQRMYLSRGTIRNALRDLYRRFEVHSQIGLVGKIISGTDP